MRLVGQFVKDLEMKAGDQVIKVGVAILVAAAGWLASSCATPLKTGRAEIVQTVEGFHRPESVVFSLDGATMFVGNCASDLFGPDRNRVGMVKGKGAISKCSVDSKGRVTIIDLKFIDELNSPLGLCVVPKATAKFPRNTLMVNQGITLLVDEAGNPITDAAALETGILFFDPESGERLGRIDLGIGSVVADKIGHSTLLPNSLAFDGNGNLFITDTAKGGDRQDPPQPAHPGLIRIAFDAIDRVAEGDGDSLGSNDVTFTPMEGVPNGVGYWAEHDAICVVTMGGTPPEGTAIYQMAASSFPRADLPVPIRGDVGTADGIAFTPAGTIVTSRFSGDMLAVPKRGEAFPLEIAKLTAPADHRLLVLPDGSSLLAVPEQARIEPEHWNQRVRMIRLPRGF